MKQTSQAVLAQALPGQLAGPPSLGSGFTRRLPLRALFITALLSVFAQAAELNQLKSFDMKSVGKGVEVKVTCTSEPVFNVFRLKDPDRLIVDVSNASVAAIRGHHEGTGAVTGVVASQFADPSNTVGRLLFGLSGESRYDVKSVGGSLFISIEGEPSAPAPQNPLSKIEAASPNRAPPQNPPSALQTSPAATPKVVNGETIMASHVDEKPVAKPAKRLKGLVASQSGMQLKTDGEVAKFEVIELADPPRLALDLFGLSGAPRAPHVGGNVKDIRIGAHAEKVRVVVEFAERANFDVRRRGDGIRVEWRPLNTAAVSPPEAVVGSAEDAVIEIDGKRVFAGETPAQVVKAEVQDVAFKESDVGGSVKLTVSGLTKWTVERPDAKSAVLNLENAKIAKQREKSFDTSSLQTPVKMVSIFAVPGGEDKVRVVVSADRAMDQLVTERPGILEWKMKSKMGAEKNSALPLQANTGAEQASSQESTAGFSTEAVAVAEEGAPQQRRGYVGKRVSFEFKDIDIHNLLRVIAEVSKKNIVVSDDVAGKVTVRLRNVPWDQALDLVLRSKSLGKEEFGNIVRVAPLAKLEEESKARLEKRKNDRLARDPVVQLIPVNYATAGEMSARVKEVLTERGTVTVDTRTNTLIVRDLPENMGKVKGMVARLDLQTPQVLIEGRIVEASTRFAREFGIQWGGQALLSQANGNPTGLAFPSSFAATGGIASSNTVGTSSTPNYAVSLPAGVGEGTGGALGMVFGSAGGAAQLNLRLSALEAQGTAKTISSPKITTLDNAQARISQGVSIPFSQVSAAGANTVFVEARLSLDVTPHITADGAVLMNIRAQNDQPDLANSGSNGQPGIARKEAQTNVLVKDGETTVIGGIYIKSSQQTENGVPFLSKIPVLGLLFKNKKELEQKSELLIFITPRILNRNASSVAQNQ
jgi:type IV pilus assembly protein PilQ